MNNNVQTKPEHTGMVPSRPRPPDLEPFRPIQFDPPGDHMQGQPYDPTGTTYYKQQHHQTTPALHVLPPGTGGGQDQGLYWSNQLRGIALGGVMVAIVLLVHSIAG